MTEERKHAILFAATILAARKLNDIGNTPWANECAIHDAIQKAAAQATYPRLHPIATPDHTPNRRNLRDHLDPTLAAFPLTHLVCLW